MLEHCIQGTNEHTVTVHTPTWLYVTKTEVGIDMCIVEEIKHLWSLGVRTYGSCCGHGTVVAMVNVHKDDAETMLILGYIGGKNHFGAMTFALKTQCGIGSTHGQPRF